MITELEPDEAMDAICRQSCNAKNAHSGEDRSTAPDKPEYQASLNVCRGAMVLPKEWHSFEKKATMKGALAQYTEKYNPDVVNEAWAKKAARKFEEQAVTDLFDYIGSLPNKPWNRPDTKETDREYWSRDYD